jgi:hypothetical protein
MGDDVDFNNVNVDGATMFGGAAALGAAGGHGMPHIDAGGLGALHHAHGAGAGAGMGDVNHAHHNAMHLSQNDLQNLFMNSDQAQGVRDQLMQQMNMPGGPGGVFVDGANGASAFVGSSPLQQAFSAADAAAADGDTNINVANLLGAAGVDLPAASFSGLNMSPIDATAMNAAGGVTGGGGNGFLPPGSDPSMARGSLDAGAIASAAGIPRSGGSGEAIVAPDTINAQRQATLDRISNEVQSSMSTITAQNQARAEQQAQQAQVAAQQQAQQQMQQQQQAQLAMVSSQQGGQMSGFGNGGGGFGPGGAGDPNGATSAADLQKQALSGMAGVYQNSADIVNTGTGGNAATLSASQLGNLDPGVSGASYAQAALSSGGGGPANVVPVDGGVTQVPNQGALPTNMAMNTGGGGVDANGNPLGGGAGAGKFNAGEYMRDTAYQAWKGENGFENRMINASISDQQMARNSVNDALTHGNTLQGHVQGTVSNTAQPQNIETSGAGAAGGYTAASPTSYAQASYTGGGIAGGGIAGGGTGGGSTGGADSFGGASGGASGGQQAMDALSKESLDKLAKQFDVTPEVRSMSGRSEVAGGGLGTNVGGYSDAGAGSTGGTFAQNSAMNQSISGYSAATPNAAGGNMGNGEPRLPQQPTQPIPQQDAGGGGFFANAPSGDAGAVGGGGQPQQFDKSSYLSGQLGEQWKQYDQKVDNALAADYKQQINGAVESTYSRASGSVQDNMTGQASNLPVNQGGQGGMPTGNPGGSTSSFASNDGGAGGGMNYQAPAPASGNSLARESTPMASSSPAPAEHGGGHHSAGEHYSAHAPNNEAVRQQMDQLADALNYTPDVNLARHSQHSHGHGMMPAAGDAGVPNSVPNQGLQYYAQQSYTSTPDQMQGMNRNAQQLPTNHQGQNAADAGVRSPAQVPVPMQLRSGNIANSRADALKNATRAKESYSGGGEKLAGNGGTTGGAGNGGTGNGGKTNKLSNALGKAASVNAAKKAAATAAAGAKSMKDPMGSVATGSTLRRLRNKRKWSEEELEAMRKLGGGADPDWEM